MPASSSERVTPQALFSSHFVTNLGIPREFEIASLLAGVALRDNLIPNRCRGNGQAHRSPEHFRSIWSIRSRSTGWRSSMTAPRRSLSLVCYVPTHGDRFAPSRGGDTLRDDDFNLSILSFKSHSQRAELEFYSRYLVFQFRQFIFRG